MALCLAGSFSFSNAQTVDSTGNLINDNSWSGATYGADPNDCCSNPGGSQPLYDTGSNTIKFSYGQATVSQVIGINTALSGTGIQINSYSWSFDARNNNGGNSNQSGTDTLTSYSYLQDGSGNILASASTQHSTRFEWNNFSGTQTLNNPYDISGGGILGIQFSGKDGGFWAGLYGPEVRNVNLRLNYSSDPCAADPLSSPTCPGYAEAYKNLMCSNNPLYDQTCSGYGAVVASGNLVPHPNDNAGYFGSTLDNSFAINTALSHSGAGVMIHGFEWGYRAMNFSVFGSSLGSSTVNVNIRDSQNNSLHTWSRNNTTAGYNYYSSSHVFSHSQNQFSLGTFEYTATGDGFGTVDNMWARALFTPDSCSLDPLSSVLCSKYEEAFLAQQCSITTLYSPSCPGYADAMAEMLAASMPTGIESTESPVAIAQVSAQISAPMDDTRDPTEVTTDVGGVELTTTGEIRVADPVPAAAKDSARESTKEEKKTLSRDQLLSIAGRAARDAENTALAAAEAAVEQSQSDAANPEDGTGATLNLGGGLSLRSLQSMTMAGQLQAGPQTLPDRTTDDDRMRSQAISQAADALQAVIDTTVNASVSEEALDGETAAKDTDAAELAEMAVTPEVSPEPVAPTGPAVRRGGRVEGMEGGADINSLAAAPADFNDYLSQQLQDSQFYASNDIYRRQRNVDNARVLRGMVTDRLHQEMVDQQYNQ